MAEITNVSKLIVNYLTEEQYQTAKASGLINENELYIESAQALLGVAHPASHPASMITGLPTSLPASGGNADTVGGFTVGVNVPSGAKFTDTVYSHPATHSISEVSGLQTTLDGKVDDSQVLTNVPAGAKFTDTVYSHPTAAGNKHVPTGGASGQVLKYSASGTATWQADSDTITTINGKTGAIAKSDITALGIPAQDTVYSHPATHPASMITQTASDRFVTDSEKTNWNSKAPGYTYGTADLTAGSSSLATGTLYFMYE